jgi:hypothetical protein
MHGIGTLESAHGVRYHGGWSQNRRHGFGRQFFMNGDVFEVRDNPDYVDVSCC